MRWFLIVLCLSLTGCAAVRLPESPMRELSWPDTTRMVWSVQDNPESSVPLQASTAPERAEQVPSEPTAEMPPDMITSKGVHYCVTDTWEVLVTAYNSEPGQTDDSPWRSANGRLMIPGYAANNRLPFGTAFRIPALFGDHIFTVEDRMNPRHPPNFVDVWMPSRKNARQFGRRAATMQILSAPRGGGR